MASNFPTSLDTFTNPTASDNLDSPDHATQHADVNDATEALQAKVGTGDSPASSATAKQVLQADGAGASAWATVAADDLSDVDTSTASPSVGDALVWDGSNWVPDSATYAAPAFQIVGALAREYSHTDWSNRAAATGWHLGGFRASNGTQNAEVVYTVPLLREGTWSLTLLHGEGTSRGIYTIATSPDASTWTDLTTIDGYASSSANSATDSVTGLTVPSGVKFVRLKMSTKNASSSGYSGAFSGLAGARTGA